MFFDSYQKCKALTKLSCIVLFAVIATIILWASPSLASGGWARILDVQVIDDNRDGVLSLEEYFDLRAKIQCTGYREIKQIDIDEPDSNDYLGWKDDSWDWDPRFICDNNAYWTDTQVRARLKEYPPSGILTLNFDIDYWDENGEHQKDQDFDEISIDLSSLNTGGTTITKTVSVSSKQPWTDTGLYVQPGDTITTTAVGNACWDTDGGCSGPAGPGWVGGSGYCWTVMDPNMPGHSLVGNIAKSAIDALSDGSGFYVGAGNTISVPVTSGRTKRNSGNLFLGYNECGIENNRQDLGWSFTGDNSGSFTVEITITPDDGYDDNANIFDSETGFNMRDEWVIGFENILNYVRITVDINGSKIIVKVVPKESKASLYGVASVNVAIPEELTIQYQTTTLTTNNGTDIRGGKDVAFFDELSSFLKYWGAIKWIPSLFNRASQEVLEEGSLLGINGRNTHDVVTQISNGSGVSNDVTFSVQLNEPYNSIISTLSSKKMSFAIYGIKIFIQGLPYSADILFDGIYPLQ